ncbi:hypothetical protein DM02DRAFT_635000 [Periconia macrospinosa]|uniref:Uncharacterized protein n=1 Tax=Periconia macrospinosa TaxID=97972 RepID=A0A2V1D4F9_9PLEO|nr:hypothetical protein DM02DRAFT_635000 [Periconia macrospinosa]
MEDMETIPTQDLMVEATPREEPAKEKQLQEDFSCQEYPQEYPRPKDSIAAWANKWFLAFSAYDPWLKGVHATFRSARRIEEHRFDILCIRNLNFMCVAFEKFCMTNGVHEYATAMQYVASEAKDTNIGFLSPETKAMSLALHRELFNLRCHKEVTRLFQQMIKGDEEDPIFRETLKKAIGGRFVLSEDDI